MKRILLFFYFNTYKTFKIISPELSIDSLFGSRVISYIFALGLFSVIRTLDYLLYFDLSIEFYTSVLLGLALLLYLINRSFFNDGKMYALIEKMAKEDKTLFTLEYLLYLALWFAYFYMAIMAFDSF
jgi:hypothetical protein